MTVGGVRAEGSLRVYSKSQPSTAWIQIPVDDLETDPDASES